MDKASDFRVLVAPSAAGCRPKMVIREAVVGDAEEACTMVRRSITELCAADHGNDPAILARWLDNKTPENVEFRVWAESGPTGVASARTGVWAKAGIPVRARNRFRSYIEFC